MLLSSVDWALRGGTGALVLLIAATLLRDYGGLVAARLAALFAIGTGAYAITRSPVSRPSSASGPSRCWRCRPATTWCSGR